MIKENYELKGYTFLTGMKAYRKDGTLKILSDEEYEQMRVDRLKDWITFYRRRNMHDFASILTY